MSLDPTDLLNTLLTRSLSQLDQAWVDETIANQIQYVACNLKNRAGVRLLMACLLAKLDNPRVDVRKPYTEIGSADSFSGRRYDERYLSPFIHQHQLPCNSTTAFLTPAFRNRNVALTKDLNLVGKPPQLYQTVLHLLALVHDQQVLPDVMLMEILRCLVNDRNRAQSRMAELLQNLRQETGLLLSSEDILGLITQHLNLKGTSRLPVLLIAAIYRTLEALSDERVLTLESHNAADIQTGAIGDVEVVILDQQQVLTSYEIKDKRVTREDVDRALQKIITVTHALDNYIFITTEPIDAVVQNYCRSLYPVTGGIEFVILDCIDFLRQFLHLFHRSRQVFLDHYQSLILAEPQSSVSQPVKEAFLAMRQVAESQFEEDS
jgi:SacI restriction endonuclease